jgi:3-dehydroquinate synthetase
VAVGCCLAFALSERLGLCPAGKAAAVRGWYAQAGLPTTLAQLPELGTTADDLLEIMRQDKKATNGKLVFVLVRDVGKAFVARDVDETAVRQLLHEALVPLTSATRN